MALRLGLDSYWKNWGPELTLDDTLITITDKDDKLHYATMEGKLEYWEEPISIDSRWLAERYVWRSEFIPVENADGTDMVFIPLCNIKTVTFKTINERKEQPRIQVRGIKDWNQFDVIFVVLPVIFGISIFSLIGGCIIYSKVMGH